jgi:hypothetical protein
MTTYIEHEMGAGEKFMLVGLAVLVIAAFAAVPQMAADSEKQRRETPCSAYAEAKLSGIPAKCITKDGGFKS